MRTAPLLFVPALVIACGSPATVPAPATPPVTTTGPEVAPVAPLVPPALRLSGDVRPTQYTLDLTIVPTAETFTGKVTIALALAAPTKVIWLHAADLTVRSATIKAGGSEQSARTVAPAPQTPDNKELLAFVVDRELAAGAAELTIEYAGQLSATNSDGIYREQDRGEWYVYTQFEATDARRAFPSFDEPTYKVPLQLTLHVKREHVAVSNTPIVSQTDDPDGMKTVRFALTKPLPTYLIALAVGAFEIVDGGTAGKNQTPLRILVPKGRTREAAYATRATPALLGLLEDYFGIPYPYEKLDQIAVPRKRGAMENVGLITYGFSLIAIPPGEETVTRKRRFASVGAHELAHQWFGNLVTLAWWDDVWLNESFASWIEDRIVARWQPSWNVDIGEVQRRSYAMAGDNLRTTRRIRQPIKSRDDISSAFDGVTYTKGSAVIAMFENWIGPDKFQRALRSYLTKHAHRTATTADFIAALTAEAGPDVEPVFASYLDQPGTPLVSVELVCAPGAPPKLALSQRRYAPIGSSLPTDQTWRVPLCATFGTGKTPGAKTCTVLAEPTGELALPTQTCPRWVNANAGGLGYYRVHYQGDLLDKLLAANVLTRGERVGVLGDLVALVESGQVPLGKTLARVQALAREQTRELTALTSQLVGALSDSVVPENLRANRARFVRKVLGARARDLGWTPRRGEPDDRRLMRSTVLSVVATVGEDPALIRQAKQLVDRWITDRKAIDPDLAGLVLRVAARNGDRALFDRLHAAVKTEADLEDRRRLLGAMGSFRDPEIAKAGFALALTDELDPRDSLSLVSGAFYDEATRELAYQFVKANLDKLLARLPRDFGAYFIRMASGFCDAAHRADAAAFFKDRAPTYLDGPRALASLTEGIDLCIAKQQAYQPEVRTFLQKW